MIRSMPHFFALNLSAVVGLLSLSAALHADPPTGEFTSPPGAAASENAAFDAPTTEIILSVESARQRAELMHTIYAATLEMMHHRYFRHDRATVPARAMEDVFSEIDRQANIRSSWIAISGRAMSIDHEPEGAFELAAVKAIGGGQDHYESADEDTYRRVGAIRLSGGCMNCHGRFGSTSTSKKFAGLVIEIPRRQTLATPGTAALR